MLRGIPLILTLLLVSQLVAHPSYARDLITAKSSTRHSTTHNCMHGLDIPWDCAMTCAKAGLSLAEVGAPDPRECQGISSKTDLACCLFEFYGPDWMGKAAGVTDCIFCIGGTNTPC
ncbi:hypothetical protein DUNSADRAFT_1071 [Dunaliella salina]|uniref:Uncharacterized protein n=1 Tax=Dunaliella salina TaxID=3046 RepID=A0ABQ7FY39_DUNSA|nr:hypothetical protein DUNSADRAFT_1071 [Dunaliella salina]|eukprot:KAF5827247.1 hypothetical protein DUNSADRAFT_1071 [Dunaliella salina]